MVNRRERVITKSEDIEITIESRKETASSLQMIIGEEREFIQEAKDLNWKKRNLIQRHKHLIHESSMSKKLEVEINLEVLIRDIEFIDAKLDEIKKMINILEKKKKRCLKILKKKHLKEKVLIAKNRLN